jgi:cysteine desulfurase
VTGVYLDYNATAKVRPEAAEAVARALAMGGNPSSVHAAGRAARGVVDAARAQVASLVGVRDGSVSFTSGGTEANALAIASAVSAGAHKLLINQTEHASIMENALASGAGVEAWPVRADGTADLAWLEARLNAWDSADGRPFVALSLANNETGVIQPIAEVSRLTRAAGGWLHVDAVQAAGKIVVDFTALGADTLSLSGHKLGAPQGVGALIAGQRAMVTASLHGGGQERGRRAGTENVAGIAGFGAAAAAALRDLPVIAEQADVRDGAEALLAQAAGVTVMGAGAPRLPTVLCFAAEGFDAQQQVMVLDLDGVMVSAGAACSSGKVTASKVLIAMGQERLAGSAIRVSSGWATSLEDWDRFVSVWLSAFARHRARRASAA